MFMLSLKILVNSLALSGLSFLFMTQFSNILNYIQSGDLKDYVSDRAIKTADALENLSDKHQKFIDKQTEMLVADVSPNQTIQIINDATNRQKQAVLNQKTIVIKGDLSQYANKTTSLKEPLSPYKDKESTTEDIVEVVNIMMEMPIVVEVSQAELDTCFKDNNQLKCQELIRKVLEKSFAQ